MPTARARLEWRARVRAEYGSAAVTAQVVQWAIACGLPDPVLRTGLRVVSDELDHADLAHGVAVAIGAHDQPEPVGVEDLCPPVSALGLGASLLDAVLRSFCLGETLAVPLFAAMRQGTEHPVARAALDRILRDEAVHRAFAWDALDALIELDGDGVRARAMQELPAMIGGFQRAYVDLPEHDPITDDERAVGLLSGAEYARITARALRDDILPRFAQRGILPGEPP